MRGRLREEARGLAAGLEPLEDAAGLLRRHPGLVVAGAAVAVAELAVAVALGAVRGATLATGDLPFGAAYVAGLALWLLLVPFPLAGLYVLVRASMPDTDGEGPGRSPTAALRGLVAGGVRGYRAVLGASVAARLATLATAVVLALALHAVVFGALTAGQAAAYRLADVQPPHPLVAVAVSGALVGLARFAGGVPFRFADTLALFGGDRPARSPLTSARFARARPRRLVAYVLVVALLLAVPVAAGVLADLGAEAAIQPPGADGFVGPQEEPLTPLERAARTAAAPVAFLLVAVPVQTLVGAYHVTFFEREVAPEVAPGRDAGRSPAGAAERPLVVRPARLALVALLVTGLLAGTAAVRTADVGSPTVAGSTTPVDVDAPAATILARARNDTGRVSRRVHAQYDRYNASTGELVGRSVFVRVVDLPDRQARVSLADGENRSLETVGVGYFAEGTMAIYGQREARMEDLFGAFVRHREEWSVVAAPGYPMLRGTLRRSDEHVPRGGEWRVARVTDDVVVLEPADHAALRAVQGGIPDDVDGHSVEVDDSSYVRVVVDRETGVVRRVERRERYAVVDGDGRVVRRDDRRVVVTVTQVRATDLERPEAIGDRGVLEWLWDAAYY